MWIFCCAHPSRWQDLTQYKLLILKTSHQFPAKPGFTTTLPFGRKQLHQAWQTSTCTISTLVWCHSPSHQPRLLHSLTQAACHSTSADHGMMAPIVGPLINADTTTAVRNAKGTTLTLTVLSCLQMV